MIATRLTLSPVIDSVFSRFPAVGARAYKASELLLAGKVQRQIDDDRGRDMWAVYGSATQPGGTPRPYQVSIKTGTCDCSDLLAPTSDRGQKLCKHMLAAMFALKMGVSAPATAAGLIAHILRGAEEIVKLYVREEWTGDQGQTQRDFVTAYRIDGAELRVNLAERLEISITQADFYETFDGAGWKMGKQYPSHGGMHVWELIPKPIAVDWSQPQAEKIFVNQNFNRDADGEIWA